MTELILKLLANDYTVTFEDAAGGGCFVLLRRVQTQELVNCVIGNTPEEALQGAVEWDESERPGNGTAGHLDELNAAYREDRLPRTASPAQAHLDRRAADMRARIA